MTWARAAVAIEDTTPKFVTHQEMAKFGDQITNVFEEKLGQIESILEGMGKKSGQYTQNRADVECYSCHEEGHNARECPLKQNVEKSEN